LLADADVNSDEVWLNYIDLSNMDNCGIVCEYLAYYGKHNPDVHIIRFHGELRSDFALPCNVYVIFQFFRQSTDEGWNRHDWEVGDS
jgi:hypothetical protein